jgi:patatin-like phospholipase/acyl hydrolase
MADQTPKGPTATHTETPAADKKPRTLLALDGGGVKGISTLILLQAIMDEVKKQEGGGGEERKPVDYFDLAAGSSTGGLIALMLFRLNMSTSQVMEVYNLRAKDIFSPVFLGIRLDKVPLGHWLAFKILLKIKTLFTGQEFSNDGLKDAIDSVV